MKKISIKKYAEKHGLSPNTVRIRAADGKYSTAEKIGRDWFIDPNEQHVDNRIKSGKYKNWRSKKKGCE